MSQYDTAGTCGVPSLFTLWDGTRFRCRFDFDHTGSHSWEPLRAQCVFTDSCSGPPIVAGKVTENNGPHR